MNYVLKQEVCVKTGSVCGAKMAAALNGVNVDVLILLLLHRHLLLPQLPHR